MSCLRNETALREHAHGAPLSPELEAHLASCAVCQDVLAAERRLLSEIDRTLDAVGRIEPSPIFLTRVRALGLDQARRRQHPERLALGGRWLVWALPALAGLVIAALVAKTRLPVEQPPAVASAPGVPSAHGTPLLTARHSPSPVVGAPSSSPATTSNEQLPSRPSRETARATRRPMARTPFPEPSVLVPPGQADALVRLAVLINAGSVAPPALLLEPPDPVQELRRPAELQIRPLVIEPIMSEGTDNEGDTL